jgi:hypothetical protein
MARRSPDPSTGRARRRAARLGVGLVVLAGVWLGADLLAGDADAPSSADPAAPVAPVSVTGSVPVPSTTATPTSTSTSTSTTTSTSTSTTTTTFVPSSTGRFEAATTPPGPAVGVTPYVEYSVATEEGSGIDPDELAAFVDETLADPRSWIGDGRHGFRRVPEGGTFTVVVATPATVDELCRPLETAGRYSCGRNGYVALNLDRWNGATDTWTASLEEYRRYLVNHEVGHYVGGQHVPCPGPGQLAPVMQQQTIRLDGCLPNGWPYP